MLKLKKKQCQKQILNHKVKQIVNLVLKQKQKQRKKIKKLKLQRLY